MMKLWQLKWMDSCHEMAQGWLFQMLNYLAQGARVAMSYLRLTCDSSPGLYRYHERKCGVPLLFKGCSQQDAFKQ